MKWYLMAMKKYDTLRGRASRKELWRFTFYNMIFIILAIAIDNMLGTTALGLPYGVFNYLYILTVIIPSVAIVIRRLHDVGVSGWFSLIIVIPAIGLIWLLVLLSKEGYEGENKYGPNPDGIVIG
jgi:uncharacterized membrane protein YhaH (DUF805 family)